MTIDVRIHDEAANASTYLEPLPDGRYVLPVKPVGQLPPGLAVASGQVTGHRAVHKFGRNANLANGSFEFVSGLGLTGWPLSAATTVRIKAGGNANDTAAGTGAREILVQGIDTTLSEVTETLATAGGGASLSTVTQFWRVHRMLVTKAGTYGSANTGTIVIENTAGGTDIIQIAAGEGQTQFCGYTVPAGKRCYLASLRISVDGAKSADVRLFTRNDITNTAAPVASRRVRRYWDGVVGDIVYQPITPNLALTGPADVWLEAQGNGANVECSAEMELLIVDG